MKRISVVQQYWWTSLLLFLGVVLITAYMEWDIVDDWFQTIGLKLLYILDIVGATAVIICGYKLYRQRKTRSNLAVMLMLVLATGGIFISKWHNYSKAQACFLKASFFHDFNGLSLLLRNDSTYTYSNYGPFGTVANVEGTFSFYGDTIVLDKRPDDLGIVSNKLLIKWDFSSSNECRLYIYQLDKHGSIVREDNRLLVLKDKRR